MSRHPSAASFNAPSHYAQQWPHPPSSSMPPMNAPDLSTRDGSSSRSQQPYNDTLHSLGYNYADSFQASSRLPGLNVHNSTAPVPPPPFPFMGQLPHSQPPQNQFPPAQKQSLAYPPMPTGTFPVHQDHPSADEAYMKPMPSSAFGTQSMTTPSSRQDLDREEGEVTDMEGRSSLSKSAERAVGASQTTHKPNGLGTHVGMPQNVTTAEYGSKGPHQFAVNSLEAPTRAVPDLEEGEAVSSVSSSSTRDSGSRIAPHSHEVRVLCVLTLCSL